MEAYKPSSHQTGIHYQRKTKSSENDNLMQLDLVIWNRELTAAIFVLRRTGNFIISLLSSQLWFSGHFHHTSFEAVGLREEKPLEHRTPLASK